MIQVSGDPQIYTSAYWYKQMQKMNSNHRTSQLCALCTACRWKFAHTLPTCTMSCIHLGVHCYIHNTACTKHTKTLVESSHTLEPTTVELRQRTPPIAENSTVRTRVRGPELFPTDYCIELPPYSGNLPTPNYGHLAMPTTQITNTKFPPNADNHSNNNKTAGRTTR